MLIDHEHFKHDSNKETRAFGWLTKLENREDGLYGQIRWSTTGKEAVDGGDYRFFSTEYDPKNLTVLNKEAKTVRPTALDGLTLTNQPNNRGGRPITNSDRNPAPQPADNPKQKTMKLIAASLGLSADASENAIVDELVRLQNRAAQLDEEQIDADLAAHGVKEETVINRLKPVLAGMNNREERLSFLADVVKPAASAAEQKKLLNRDGKAPSKDGAEKERESATKIANRAAELRKSCPTLTQASAFIQAKAEIEG
jgi:phage I-like protein